MTVDWASFTPASAAIGGALIGLAAAMLLLFNGRIAGVSGILGGLLQRDRSEWAWRLAFVAGLALTPTLYLAVGALPEFSIDTSYPVLVAAGILVGAGTRYGGGCTSGHGVCGLSRLSPRSLVATACFMLAGFATVFVARHLLGA